MDEVLDALDAISAEAGGECDPEQVSALVEMARCAYEERMDLIETFVSSLVSGEWACRY